MSCPVGVKAGTEDRLAKERSRGDEMLSVRCKVIYELHG